LLVVGGDVKGGVAFLVLGVSIKVFLQQQQFEHVHVTFFASGVQWCTSSLEKCSETSKQSFYLHAQKLIEYFFIFCEFCETKKFTFAE